MPVQGASDFIGTPFWCTTRSCTGLRANLVRMAEPRILDELGARMSEALRNSPAQDLEKNLRALAAAFLDRMDVVTREDFEAQKRVLERAERQLAELEARLAELEANPGQAL